MQTCGNVSKNLFFAAGTWMLGHPMAKSISLGVKNSSLPLCTHTIWLDRAIVGKTLLTLALATSWDTSMTHASRFKASFFNSANLFADSRVIRDDTGSSSVPAKYPRALVSVCNQDQRCDSGFSNRALVTWDTLLLTAQGQHGWQAVRPSLPLNESRGLLH